MGTRATGPTSATTGSNAGLGLAALGVLAFSLTAPATKIVVQGSSVLFASAGRSVLAAIAAATILLAERAPRPPREVRRHLGWVVAGVGLGFPILNAWGLHTVPSAHGAVVIALLPLATAGVAALVAGERPSRRYWACSAVGVGAVLAFVVGQGTGGLQMGDLLLLGAVIAASFGYAHGAMASRVIPGRQVICWAVVLALPAVVPLAAIGLRGAGAPDTAGQWGAFAYTVLVSNLAGFFVWYAGLARAGIARAGQLQLAQPMLSLVWAWPLVGERLTLRAVLASAVVIGAVAVGRTARVATAVLPSGG